jgi:CRP-like cAMP-binding protein
MRRKPIPRPSASISNHLDARAVVRRAGVVRRTVEYAPLAVIFAQGDPCEDVMCVQKGTVSLTVLSRSGREAIVAMLGPGDFLGEGALAGQRVRMSAAKAVTPTTLLVIPKKQMVALLRDDRAFANRFIRFMLARNIRIEQDLVDQMFNSSEKRLARALLLLARYGMSDTTDAILPKLSQAKLAEMVGTTRSRVNLFMNKFRKLGFIEYNGGLKINTALWSVVLHD